MMRNKTAKEILTKLHMNSTYPAYISPHFKLFDENEANEVTNSGSKLLDDIIISSKERGFEITLLNSETNINDMDKEEFKKKIIEERAINKEAAKIRLKEYWNNLKPFETCHDVPTLPVVDANEWVEYYIPALIKAGAIPKADLVDGVYYHGAYRNSDIGKWNAEDNKFHILRRTD